MQKFIEKDIPLTLAIMYVLARTIRIDFWSSNFFGTDFNPQSKLTPFIKAQLDKRPVKLEIGKNHYLYYEAHFQASHTPNHEAINMLGIESQILLLKESRDTLEAQLPNNPLPFLTLVPPYNLFNTNTVKALYKANYETICSENSPSIATANGVTFYNNCNQSTGKQDFLFHWPEGAATSVNGNGTIEINSLNNVEIICLI